MHIYVQEILLLFSSTSLSIIFFMLKKIKYNRIGYHLLFWGMFLLYRLTTSTSQGNLIGDYWWGDWKIICILFVEVIFKAIFAYGLIYFIVPKFLDTKKYVLFGGSALIWMYIVLGMYITTHYYYLEHVFTLNMWYDKAAMTTMIKRMSNVGFLLHLATNFLFPSLVLGAIKFYKNQMMLSKIEEEKNKMELKVLKNQLNPHFLFNTLNNLYSSVVTNSPDAPDMILRLSGILDYALYKSQNKAVPLREEVEVIENFIELEKIRYGERLKVNFESEGDLSIPISPLLLLSFVENAFKHGASGDIDHPQIKINIQEKNKQIHFEVWNTKTQHQGELTDVHKEGIGISNTKRQLNLIYPDRHELVIEDKEKTFCISLVIKP